MNHKKEFRPFRHYVINDSQRRFTDSGLLGHSLAYGSRQVYRRGLYKPSYWRPGRPECVPYKLAWSLWPLDCPHRYCLPHWGRRRWG